MSQPSESEKPEIELAADEDWKERVKAEDAKLDAQAKAQSTATETAGTSSEPKSSGQNPQLPPADFSAIVQMFVLQAFGALGMFPGPDGKPSTQLPIARHLIDLLGVLEEKTKGNLTSEESRSLDEALHEMRMAYVQVAQQSRQSTPS